jgi:hypothetical protein
MLVEINKSNGTTTGCRAKSLGLERAMERETKADLVTNPTRDGERLARPRLTVGKDSAVISLVHSPIWQHSRKSSTRTVSCEL